MKIKMITKHICIVCGKEFEDNFSERLFCSKKCHDKQLQAIFKK